MARGRAASTLAAVAAAALISLAAAAASSGQGSPSAGTWVPLAGSTTARQEATGARVGDAIYCAGGFGDDFLVDNEPRVENEDYAVDLVTERYDLDRNSWTRLSNMPLALHHHSAVEYRGDMYVVGGYAADDAGAARSDGHTIAILLRYDPESDSWEELPPPPTKRGALAAGVIGDKLYVAGGFNVADQELNRLEIYDFRTREWSRGPDMEVPRQHVAAAVSGGKLYVLGGRIDALFLLGNVPTVERYDPVRRRWERMPDMLWPRSSFSAATLGDGRIVALGGEFNHGVTKEVEAFDPAKGSWSRLPDMRTPRHAMCVDARERRVYALEGSPEPRSGTSNVAEMLEVHARGATVGAPPSSAPDARPAPRLHVAVRPRPVRAGRRTRVVVTAKIVSGQNSEPVKKATVRFAARRAVTDVRGRARLTVHLRHSGTRRVVATRPGLRPGKARVRVLPPAPRR